MTAVTRDSSGFRIPSQDTTNAFLNDHPLADTSELYALYDLDRVEDPELVKRVKNIIRQQKTRWKQMKVQVNIKVPTVEEVVGNKNVTRSVAKEKTQKITMVARPRRGRPPAGQPRPSKKKLKEVAQAALQGYIDGKLIEVTKGASSAKNWVANRVAGNECVDESCIGKTAEVAAQGKPQPTGRHWQGEQWRRKADGTIEWYLPKEPVPLDYYHWYLTFKDDKEKYNPYFPPGVSHEEVGGILDSLVIGDIGQFLAHRDWYKSTYIDEGFSEYNILEKSDSIGKKGILVVTWDDSLAQRTYTNIIEDLMLNERIVSFYGYVIDDEATTNARDVKKKRKFTQTQCFFRYQPPGVAAGLRCTSFQSGGITGWHPGLVILDDMEDDELTDTYMRKFKRILLKKLFPAVSKTGIIIVTGTIKGWSIENDIYLLLEKSDSVQTFRYPAVTDQEGNALFPDMKDVIYHSEDVPLTTASGAVRHDRFGRVITKKRYVIDEIKGRERFRVTFPEKFSLEDLIIIRLKYRFGEVKDQNDDDFFSEFQLQASNPAGKVFKMHRVFVKPPMLSNVRRFINYDDFVNFYHKETTRIPVYLFVDPGGKDSHGISIAVLAVVNGERWGALKWVVLDAVVVRKGLVDVAVKIAQLLERWHVTAWAVEGNFDQKEAYGTTLDRELHRYCERNNLRWLYKNPAMPSNDTDKLTRINKEISAMIGHEEQPEMFYVNPECEDFERLYKQELMGFGFAIKPSQKHEFDLLDCIASISIHMLGSEETEVVGFDAMYTPEAQLGV